MSDLFHSFSTNHTPYGSMAAVKVRLTNRWCWSTSTWLWLTAHDLRRGDRCRTEASNSGAARPQQAQSAWSRAAATAVLWREWWHQVPGQPQWATCYPGYQLPIDVGQGHRQGWPLCNSKWHTSSLRGCPPHPSRQHWCACRATVDSQKPNAPGACTP